MSFYHTTLPLSTLFDFFLKKKREINGYLRIVPQKIRKILKKTNNVV